jgi:hypothetical protein
MVLQATRHPWDTIPFQTRHSHEALHSYNLNPIGVSDPIIVRTTISDFTYLPRVEYQTKIKKLLTTERFLILL